MLLASQPAVAFCTNYLNSIIFRHQRTTEVVHSVT